MYKTWYSGLLAQYCTGVRIDPEKNISSFGNWLRKEYQQFGKLTQKTCDINLNTCTVDIPFKQTNKIADVNILI